MCPTRAKSNLYTVGMIDNIDVDYKSKMTKDSFHGTALSVAQMPTKEVLGLERSPIKTNNNLQTNLQPLPLQMSIK